MSWDSVSNGALWDDIEWFDLRAALSRPLNDPRVEVSNEEETTRVWLVAPQRNEQVSGPHIEAMLIVAGKPLPYKVAQRNYAMVCTMHCYFVRRPNRCP